MTDKKTEEEVEWYTTTFKIPVWLRDKMMSFAKEKEMTGMNMVVVTACTSFIFTREKREKNNELVEFLHEKEAISEDEKEILWID